MLTRQMDMAEAEIAESEIQLQNVKAKLARAAQLVADWEAHALWLLDTDADGKSRSVGYRGCASELADALADTQGDT